jgi:hypothetical protein
MSPLTVLAFTVLLFLAIVGGVAGIFLERQRSPSQRPWRYPAVRDALLPIAGWASLFVLDLAVALVGAQTLPVGVKHLLGTLAVLLLYYAVLSTLRLIYRSLRRIWACMRSDGRPFEPRPFPVLGRLVFPTLFVSAVLATLSVLHYDGLTQNLAVIACIAALLGIVRRTRCRDAAPAQRAAGE